MLLALPAMRVLRSRFPDASLDLMGRPERLSLIAHDLRAESLLAVDRAGMAYFYAEEAPLPPDPTIYFSGVDLNLLFARSENRTLSENLTRAGCKKIIQISPFPEAGPRIPLSEYYLAELRKTGITGEDGCSPLLLPERAGTFAGNFWGEHGIKKGTKILAIHPGSGSPRKNWAPENFAAIADWASRYGEVLLISGPARDGAAEVKQGTKKAKPICADRLPLLDLAALLAECSAYVGNDSGITHLAALAGIPTAAVFGPTDPVVWGPLGPRVHIITAVVPCTATGPSPCPGESLKCIKAESVIEVLAPFMRR